MCTLVTSGQVASKTFRPRRCASACTAFDTPWALKMTVAPSGTSSSSSTNTAPERAQAVDHVTVVHDFVAHVDRRAEQLDRALDDVDRAVDTGAEAARIGEQDAHGHWPPARGGCAERVQHQQHGADRDRGVGDVEGREVRAAPVHVDEVDHVAVRRRGR